jgi:hypothetical protein
VSRFERIYAVACACCKADGADVPQVEAVIELLLPRLQSAYEEIVTDITDQGVDLLTSDPHLPDETLVLLLAAYVTEATRRGLRPLSQETAGVAEEAAVAMGADPAAAAQAAQQLQLQIEALIARGVQQSVPTASRLAVAGLGTFAPQEALAAARASLAVALDVEGALRPLLDSWAYQTYNAASIRAAARDGDNFIMLKAIRDNNTTTFCRLVDGRVVPMAQALAQLRRVADAVISGDTAALISAAPFHPNPNEATQAEVDAVIAAGGLAPFHFGCRTLNVPVRLEISPAGA